MNAGAHKWTGVFSNKSAIELKKLILLALCFFCMFLGHTIIRELKDLVFVSFVGLHWLNYAKIMSMFILLPLVFVYSRFVDLLRRHQLIYFYFMLYGIGGLLCAYFLGHPSIGFANTHPDSSRLFGWIFYFFFEGYQPFVISVMWAFMNSVTKAEEVQDSYVVVTASSKLGGIIAAGVSWSFLLWQDSSSASFSYPVTFQILLIVGSCFTLSVPFLVRYLMKTIPSTHLHGYEAAYRFEKERSQVKEHEGLWSTIKKMFAGLSLLVRYPYTLGIFGMIFFWEVLNVIFNYIRLMVSQSASHSTCAYAASLYQQMCWMHIVGFFIAIIGTRKFVQFFGERRSLIAVPLLLGAAISYYLAVRTMFAATVCYIAMRAIHYAFAYPLRESLYIPTTKDVKFKTKSWIDGFGAKLSKTFGSFYNIIVSNVAASTLFSVHALFFAGVIGLWMVMAHFLGKRFEEAIRKDEVIGAGK